MRLPMLTCFALTGLLLGAAGPALAQRTERATIQIRAEVIAGISKRSMATATKNMSFNWDGGMEALLQRLRQGGTRTTISDGIVVRYFLTDARGTELIFQNVRLALRGAADAWRAGVPALQRSGGDDDGNDDDGNDDQALARYHTGRFFVNMHVCACAI